MDSSKIDPTGQVLRPGSPSKWQLAKEILEAASPGLRSAGQKMTSDIGNIAMRVFQASLNNMGPVANSMGPLLDTSETILRRPGGEARADNAELITTISSLKAGR